MAILMPALQKAKRQARSAVCQMNLKQWSIIWSVYCDDNNGFFLTSTGGGVQTEDWPKWMRGMKDY